MVNKLLITRLVQVFFALLAFVLSLAFIGLLHNVKSYDALKNANNLLVFACGFSVLSVISMQWLIPRFITNERAQRVSTLVLEILNVAILFAGFVWMAVQFVRKGDACDMIEDLDGLFRREVGRRCYILNGVEICDTDSSHTGDFGLPAIDNGCDIAKAASAIAGVSWLLSLVTLVIAVRGIYIARSASYLKERQRFSRDRTKSMPLSDDAAPPGAAYGLENFGTNRPTPAATTTS